MYFHYESSLKIVRMPELGPANHVARLVRYSASFISRFALFAITDLMKQEKAMPFPV